MIRVKDSRSYRWAKMVFWTSWVIYPLPKKMSFVLDTYFQVGGSFCCCFFPSVLLKQFRIEKIFPDAFKITLANTFSGCLGFFYFLLVILVRKSPFFNRKTIRCVPGELWWWDRIPGFVQGLRGRDWMMGSDPSYPPPLGIRG